MKTIKQNLKLFFGLFEKITTFTPTKEVLIKNCSNCNFNSETNCGVGTYLANKGRNGVCYEGELWNIDQKLGIIR